MFWRTSLVLFFIVVALALGVLGGSLLGGVAGYSLAASRASAVQSAVGAQFLSASTPVLVPAVSNSSANQAATVVDTVKTAEPAVVTILNTTQTLT